MKELKDRGFYYQLQSFTQDDIPALLEMVVELQKPARKKQMDSVQLPNADIIKLKNTQ